MRASKSRGVPGALLRPALFLCAWNLLAATLAAQCTNPTQIPSQTISSGSPTFSDNNALEATAVTINGGGSVTFFAGRCIHLGPGFRATAGTAPTTFHAWVDSAPYGLSVSPPSGSGFTQQFAWDVSSPAGYSYVTDIYALFAPALTGQNACYIRFSQQSNLLYLADNAATTWGNGLTPQGAGTLSNSQCSVNASQSSIAGSGAQLTLRVSVMFQPSFAGTQNSYLLAYDQAGLYSGWQQVGTWTVGGASGAPTITGVSPSAGAPGTPVTITGANFLTSGTVAFDGVAASVLSWTTNSITAIVPAGATSGNVVVTVGGVPSNGWPFTVTTAPTITGLSPSAGPAGAAITITGANFGATQGASAITFNGVAATATIWSRTSISTNLPAGATTGNVIVTVGGVPSNGVHFSVTNAPTISGLSSTSRPIGASITISGANFGSSQGTNTVKFNGATASVSSWSATSITATVPAGATSGSVIVTVGRVASNGIAFTVTAGPGITSLSPAAGPAGAPVLITGTNFGATQGASAVRFNGASAYVSSWSATSISFAVPAGASTGNVVVTVGGAASNAVPFTVTEGPSISLLSPDAGQPGTPVVITGSGFGAAQGTSTVKFNGVVATVSSWSATSITTAVPGGATAGHVIVTVAGVASNGAPFTVTVGPTITGIAPSAGPVGSTVTITGTNFGTQCAGCVTFNGTPASVITSWSPTSISVVVPAGATNGNVVVTMAGVASNGFGFSVYPPPTIGGIAPTSGAVGSAVTVTGANFGMTQGSNSVRFNGTPATAVMSWSTTSIIAQVPAGATSGPVSVVVNSTTATSPQSFTVNTTTEPSINSIAPPAAPAGASVTIAGANFGSPQGSSTLTFNGVQATALWWSNSSITAIVPPGATSGNVVVEVNSHSSNPVPFLVGVVPAREYIRMAGRVVAIENSAPQVLPAITSLSVSSGAIGAPVTITGTNFGTSGASGTVSFNGTSAIPTSWSATSIQTTVPGGATTGNVVVTVSGAPSNGVYFSVNIPPSVPSLSIIKSHSGNFVRGQQGLYTINISNGSAAGPTSGTVAVSDTLPVGLTFANMYGTGWGCSGLICSRSDVLAPGSSYPPVSVVVNVASNAPSSVINQATVSGGNNPSPVTASDTAGIITAPTLFITKTHSGNFVQGQTGTYTVTVFNQSGATATSGAVTVIETLPTGLTLSSMYGTGWSCGGNTCSRSDSLAPGASYPPITIVVNVASNAGTPLVNSVSVWGGGSAPASTTDSVNVNPPSLAPQWVSVVPSTGTGTIGQPQTFQVDFSDANGAADITNMQFMLNSTPSTAQACWIWYSNGIFYLADITGQSWSSSNLSNGLCTLNLASSAATTVNATMKRMSVNLSFNENVFSGLKFMYTWASDTTGLNSGSLFSTWRGNWTVPANISVSISPFSSVYVALGHTQAFTASVAGSPNTNVNWSLPDGGGTLVPSGNSATYAAPTTTPGNPWLRVRATSQADPSKYAETWVQVLSYSPNGLTLLTISPVNGAGNRATFTFGVNDVYGVSHVTWLQPFFSVTFPLNTGAGGCHMIFYPTSGNPSTGTVYLDGPGGGNTWSGGSSSIGAGGATLQNGLCMIRAASSSIYLAGNDYYLNLDIEFQGALVGTSKREYLSAGSQGNPWPGTDWLYFGWWY